jgi:hypothetical protein
VSLQPLLSLLLLRAVPSLSLSLYVFLDGRKTSFLRKKKRDPSRKSLQTLSQAPTLSFLFKSSSRASKRARRQISLLLLALPSGGASLDHVGDVAFPAVDAVKVLRHESGRAALRAGLPEALDLAAVVDLEELEHAELDLAVLVLLLLRLGVRLFLALLASSEQRQRAVERRVGGDADERERVLVRRDGAAGKGQALERGGEAWMV